MVKLDGVVSAVPEELFLLQEADIIEKTRKITDRDFIAAKVVIIVNKKKESINATELRKTFPTFAKKLWALQIDYLI
jgi:hypothetical protein